MFNQAFRYEFYWKYKSTQNRRTSQTRQLDKSRMWKFQRTWPTVSMSYTRGKKKNKKTITINNNEKVRKGEKNDTVWD